MDFILIVIISTLAITLRDIFYKVAQAIVEFIGGLLE